MTDKQKHASIYAALAAAQADMGRAQKQANNPQYKSKYADLGNVMDACMPALTGNGICVVQPVVESDIGRVVKTVLIHESGESLECAVPLLLAKNDMQGLGSAITYARRYGLMSMAGIAPEDDDGNAASRHPQPKVSHEQIKELDDLARSANMNVAVVASAYGGQNLADIPASAFEEAKKRLNARIAILKEKVEAAKVAAE